MTANFVSSIDTLIARLPTGSRVQVDILSEAPGQRRVRVSFGHPDALARAGDLLMAGVAETDFIDTGGCGDHVFEEALHDAVEASKEVAREGQSMTDTRGLHVNHLREFDEGQLARECGEPRAASYRGRAGAAWLAGYDAEVERQRVGRPKNSRTTVAVGRVSEWDDSLCRGDSNPKGCLSASGEIARAT